MELAEPNAAPKSQPTPSEVQEQEEERRKLRRLQIMMNMVMSVISQDPDLTVEEASEMVANTKRAALAMFPDKEFAYDILYKPRLQRLMAERFRFNRLTPRQLYLRRRRYNVAHGFPVPQPLVSHLSRQRNVPRAVSVLRQFLFSEVREGITYLSVHPVAWSEPTILERRFDPGVSPKRLRRSLRSLPMMITRSSSRRSGICGCPMRTSMAKLGCNARWR